jgi:ribosomal protein L33
MSRYFTNIYLVQKFLTLYNLLKFIKVIIMAAKTKRHVKMQSTESGYFYVTFISKSTKTKLLLKKYDAYLRRHVDFKQASLK